jgi:hypothetical protein
VYGQSDSVLLISGLGQDGRGGLFVFDGSELSEIDPVSTTGLCAGSDWVGRLVPAVAENAAEFLVYDSIGVVDYRRMDDMADPHDLIRDVDGSWLMVSSTYNALMRLVPGVSWTTVWQPSTVEDSWHLNCITAVDGDLWVTGFGHFDRSREWEGGNGRGRGFLRNLTTGEELGGLSGPHSPRWREGRWLVCNSYDGTVVSWEPGSAEWTTVVSSLSFPRGMEAEGDRLYVGESGRRGVPEERASVAVVEDGAVVERVLLPCMEVYDLIRIPESLVRGLRRGFATNSQRVVATAREVSVTNPRREGTGTWPTVGAPGVGLPVDTTAIATRVDCVTPSGMERSETLQVPVTVTNAGDATLASAAPFPVFLSYRWIDDAGAQVDGPRKPLGRILDRGDSVATDIWLQAPVEPGTYKLSIGLVQEGVIWFDEVDPANSYRTTTDIS